MTFTLFALFGMDVFSSSMPCSPEYSAEWVRYILMMDIWGKPLSKETGYNTMGRCILSRLQKMFPVLTEIGGTHM